MPFLLGVSAVLIDIVEIDELSHCLQGSFGSHLWDTQVRGAARTCRLEIRFQRVQIERQRRLVWSRVQLSELCNVFFLLHVWTHHTPLQRFY